MKREPNPKTSKKISVEAAGFKDGANGVAPEDGQQKIDSIFARHEGSIIEEGAEHEKELEAHASTLALQAEEAKAYWQVLSAKYGNKHPRFFVPCFLLLISFAALAAEAILLAPILDILGIADPDYQLWAAGAIVTVAAICFHHYLERRQEQSNERLPHVLAGMALIGLAVLGVERAMQLEFAASHWGNPLGIFLSAHSWLGKMMFVLLTVGFPVAAAIAFHQAAHQLHEWFQFRRSRSRARKLPAAAERVQKQLEGHQQRIEQQIQQLREQSKEWKAAYRAHHALGVQVGAKRRPRWTVWAKATVAASILFVVVALAACWFEGTLTTFGLTLSSLLAAAGWLAAAVYFHRKWEHPSPEQYLKQANLRFRGDVQPSLRPIDPVTGNESVTGSVSPQPAAARHFLVKENAR